MFNYYFDAEREGHDDVVRLFEAIRAGAYEGYASTLVTDELKRAPEPKRGNMLDLMDRYSIHILKPSSIVMDLAKLYINNGIIPSSHLLDSAHIAMASVSKLDCVVSYNFHHINRSKTRNLTSVVNQDNGYSVVFICSAKEVLDNEG